MSDGTNNARRAAILSVFHAYNDEVKRQAGGISNSDDLAGLIAVSAAMTVEMALRSCPDPMQVLAFLTKRINRTMADLPDARLACTPVAGHG